MLKVIKELVKNPNQTYAKNNFKANYQVLKSKVEKIKNKRKKK